MTGPCFESHTLPPEVEIRDVGPRDGLQGERPLNVADRVALIHALLGAGVRRVEVGAFVSPRVVPAMAQTDEVFARLGRAPGVLLTALAPNLRGAREALICGADEITVTVSASDEYGRRNIDMTLAESLEQLAQICRMERPEHVRIDAVISCAFGSPYEGDIPPSAVARIADEVRSRGCDRVTFADTTGMATPRRIDEVVQEAGNDVCMHFHESRGTGLANLFAALLLGVRRFDTSLGGLGGSPFATDSAGNVATEDAVGMLTDMNIQTGVRLAALLEASALLRNLVGHPLPSAVASLAQKSDAAAQLQATQPAASPSL